MHEYAKVPENGSTATPEGAALVLLQLIANAEHNTFGNNESPDRSWILATYSECLRTVRGSPSAAA
jgi:hypothetical protein